MAERRLKLKHDPTEHTLVVEIVGELCRTMPQLLRLRAGQDEAFVREAILTTGLVGEQQGELVVKDDLSLSVLLNIVGKMLDYFHAAGEPTDELVEVQRVVDRLYLEEGITLPWLAHAWLDVMVRESLANDVRDAADIWTSPKIKVDAERHCERFVQEALARFGNTTAASRPRMSPRANQRGDREQRETG
jgi:hypothetical protein